jgi:[ribosomal protein S5]-alanine N-acetyltransferase
MILETSRLTIMPLTYNLLQLYLEPGHALERSLGLHKGCRTIPQALVEALQNSILPKVAANPQDFLFLSIWTIISKKDGIMVGDLCFKGTPNHDGEVELGYGTYETLQGRGYMTEAVGVVTNWALGQTGIKAVLAETAPDNLASQRVLEKNHFIKNYQLETGIFWKREAPEVPQPAGLEQI